MSVLRELPWLIALAAALAALVVSLRSRRGGRDSAPAAGQGDGHGAGRGEGTGWTPPPPPRDDPPVLVAVRGVREAVDRQARVLGELRAEWSRGMTEVERKLDALSLATGDGEKQGRGSAGPDAGSAFSRPPASGEGGSGGWRESGGGADPLRRADDDGTGGVYDPALYGAESLTRPHPPHPSHPSHESHSSHSPHSSLPWSPGPGDQPVEVRDGVLVASRSLPPSGFLSAGGSGEARVYLNAEVQLTEFSLPKWAVFFDLQGAKPYAAYRTLRPAEVRWDAAAARGELMSKGLAEAI